MTSRRCACPSPDANECVRLRYPGTWDDPREEWDDDCDCVCHDEGFEDDEWDDEWDDEEAP